MGTVVGLRRYPVKSMLGEDLASVSVTERGLSGDRAFAVLDETGTVGSAKHPRKWGPLLRCRSRFGADGAVRVELPDGSASIAGDAELDKRLAELLNRRVTLTDRPGGPGRLERAVPDYPGGVPEVVRERAFVDETGESVTAGQVADGTFFDFGRVHLVTTAGLDRLRAAHPAGDFDARRFRPNLVVDVPGVPDLPDLPDRGFPEDAWLGRTLRIGEVLFRVTVPTPRCVVPTLAHGNLPADPAIMRTVAREHRVPVLTLGPLSCVGVYLDVLEPGELRIGDAVALG
ncbi:uncharacterized protein YcbX [Kitasatospora sp. MAA4]|uniref:MOSC domain-containing protein n=1 Tax=Kitasatospora sp. MAA4 TaxID=3035093 RepID=UPI002474E977|nr:MOSC N-terminal beta barrel domain-containing protein [Kitasatospora sp. MAA4]MDH6137872.1 uncharacterized protein YcbX [Kitasatospora sp. MAA4]